MKEGLVYENVTFGFPNVDCSSALSVIYTGTYPFYNGIPSDKVYNLSLRREEFALNDPEKIGNYTDETYSPKNLKTSTLSDEIKIVGNGLGRVFSVAPSAQHAIISAGHAANSAFWLNEKNGKWATTTYYLDVPIYVEQRNYNQSLFVAYRYSGVGFLFCHRKNIRHFLICGKIFLLNIFFLRTGTINMHSLRRRHW